MDDLKSIVVDQARACGFDLVRVTGADEFERDREEALRRISDGHMDGLPWFTGQRVRRGASPLELLPGARSVICLGLSYLTRNSGAEDTGDGELPAGAGGPLRLGAGLPPGHQAADAGLRPGLGSEPRQGHRRPLVRGRRSDAGPGRRQPFRVGLVRQEHQHIDAQPRFLGVFGPSDNRPGPGGRPSAEKDLRELRPLHRRLPHRGHRGPLRGRQLPVHLLSDHREPGPDSPGTASPHARLDFRLRHLPGRLPGQPQGSPKRDGIKHRAHRDFL